jgi:hypothetical protein
MGPAIVLAKPLGRPEGLLIADEMSLDARHLRSRRSRIVEEGVRHLVVQSANFIWCETRDGACASS